MRDNFTEAHAARDEALAELSRQYPKFSRSCELFVLDQRDFSSNKGCSNRLQESEHEFFVGSQDGTLRSDLRRLSNKRMGSETWAAHDLSRCSRMLFRSNEIKTPEKLTRNTEDDSGRETPE